MGEGIRGTVVSVVFLTGATVTGVAAWLQQYVSLGVLLGLVLALFIFGLYRASYEIESEKRALEDKIETDEQRAALKEVLAEAMREGQKLLRSNPSSEEAEEWVGKIYHLLSLALLDTSEAEVFVSDEGLPPLDYHDPVLRHVQTDAQKWIRRRLARLADLIRRADSLRIRPGFNGRDYIVPD